MYEAHFNLRELPFALTPDPAFLYESPQHKSGLAMLRYGLLSRTGFSLLTGEVGSGKTLLVRQMIASLGADVTVGLISNTTRQLGRILPWVCIAFGVAYEGRDDAALYQAFIDFLVAEYAAGRQVVLIVDEAQNLGVDMLEELRVLSNVNADKHLVLQTLLVGQPELLEILKRPQLRQLTQRIGVNFHIGSLTRDETYAYVAHRLFVAGGDASLISQEAVDLAFDASGGLPRLVNQLCDMALVYTFADQRASVDADLMRQAIADRSKGGLLPKGERVLAGTSGAGV